MTTIQERIMRHLRAVEADATRYQALCARLDEAYVPQARLFTGEWDTHPHNKRAGQAHASVPLIYLTVNLKSSIMGMRPPQFNLRPVDRKDPTQRETAELVENAIDLLWVEENMDQFHFDFNRCISLYGRGVMQVGKNFTTNVDQQYHVWISWKRLGEPEAMSFAELVSEETAYELGWDGVSVDESLRFKMPMYGALPHNDPIGARQKIWPGQQNTTVAGMIPVLHFYHKTDKVRYTRLVNGQITNGKGKGEVFTGSKDWPFIWVEAEHVPGFTNGVGDAEPILGIQNDLSEINSWWMETARRNHIDRWKAWGLNHLTPKQLKDGGIVWEMTSKEDEDIQALPYPVDDVSIVQLVENFWNNYRKVSGVPTGGLGEAPGAHESGYLANIRYQGLITNLASRKIRQQTSYRKWAQIKLDWVKKEYPQFKDFLESGKFVLEIVYEPITPKDILAEVQRLTAQVQAKLISPYSAMEELGLVPEEELLLLAEFLTDPKLNPQGAMAEAQAKLMLQQVAQQSAAAPGTGFGLDQLIQKSKEEALRGIAKGTPENNQANLTAGSQLRQQVLGGSPIVENRA